MEFKDIKDTIFKYSNHLPDCPATRINHWINKKSGRICDCLPFMGSVDNYEPTFHKCTCGFRDFLIKIEELAEEINA